MEGDITELANELFKGEPKNNNSYCITFEDYKINEVFEMLMYLLTECLKRKFFYNKPFDLETLQIKDFNKVNQYMKSIGIYAILEIYTQDEWINKNIILFDKLEFNSNTK